MNILFETNKRGYSIKLSGDVNYGNVSELLEKAREIAEKPKNTTIDWSKADWVHYACFQVLMSLAKTLRTAGKEVVFIKNKQGFGDVMEQYGVNDAIQSQAALN